MRQIYSPLDGFRSPFGRLMGSTAPFTPAVLFGASEPGVWYDPSDLTTLFQDTAGTTPVTTPGQTVALALDKSKGLVLGPAATLTAWSASNTGTGTATISGDSVTIVGTDGSNRGRASRSLSVVAGSMYRVDFTLTITSGAYTILVDNTAYSGGWFQGSPTQSGSFLFRAVSAGTAFIAVTTNSGGGNVTLNVTSVKELPGFHATQATLASRPTYGIVPLGGRRNLLTRTEEFNDAVWTKTNATVTVDAIAAPNSTTTADALFETTATGFHSTTAASTVVAATAGQSYTFSFYLKANGRTKGFMSVVTGADFTTFDLTAKTNVFGGNGTNVTVTAQTITELPNGWFRLTSTVSISGNVNIRPVIGINNDSNVSSYAGDATKGFYLWGAQLETGSSATAYQRVGSAFDVTEAGVASLSYLSFDGVDDFMVTPTITPGIDKAQVFAGVRKLSDPAFAVIAETSASFNSNAGSLLLFTNPGLNGFVSRGSATGGVAGTIGATAPVTSVLTGLGDIAADVSNIRQNGITGTAGTGDQGTGNYLAYPMYIGRRGGTLNPINMQLFSLITRFGTNLDAGTITSTETWVNGKTGAYT